MSNNCDKTNVALKTTENSELLTLNENVLCTLRKRNPHPSNSKNKMVPYTNLSANFNDENNNNLNIENKIDYEKGPNFNYIQNILHHEKLPIPKHGINQGFHETSLQNIKSSNNLANEQLDINCYENDKTPLIANDKDITLNCYSNNNNPKRPNLDKHSNLNALSTPTNGHFKSSNGPAESHSNFNDFEEETSFTVTLQIFLPYLVAGFGTVGAGMVLDIVQHWPVFSRINELFILVPSLLGLKGNLEMTLASRLSTQANLGTMDLEPTKIYEAPSKNNKIVCKQASVHNSASLQNYIDEDEIDQTEVKFIASSSSDNNKKKRKSLSSPKSSPGKSGQNWSLIGGNLALVQGQAAIIGFLASITALVMGWFPSGQFNIEHAKILCASSILTASLASAILGVLMVLVVVLSRKLSLNPDNIATPIAASLGDLITLTLLGFISKHISEAIELNPWIFYVVMLLYAVLTPGWLYLCSQNEYTRDVLRTGWGPIIYSMLISSGGGFILDFTVHRFRGIAVFQPVINGVGGNLAAIQASRLSTFLHKIPKQATPSKVPNDANFSARSGSSLRSVKNASVEDKRNWPSFRRTFMAQDINSKTARILLMLVVPGHLIFMYTISYMNAGHTTITPLFALVYLLAALIQVTFLLYLTEWMVNRMWALGIDPDNAAIPYITAIGDLMGTGLLALAFYTLWTIGDKDSDLGD